MTKKVAELAESIKTKLQVLQQNFPSSADQLTLQECLRECGELLAIVRPKTPTTNTASARIEPIDKLKLLVVDDDEDAQKILLYALKKKGFDVVSRTDPTQALQELSDISPNLILLDIMMPGMTGFEFLEKVRRHPLRETFSIIVGSSRNFDSDRVAVLEAGASDFIAKPYNLSELAMRLRNLIN